MKIKPVSSHKSFCTRPRPHYGPCLPFSLTDVESQPKGEKMKLSWLKKFVKRYRLEFTSDQNEIFEAGVMLGAALARKRDEPAAGPTDDIASRRWVETTPVEGGVPRTWDSVR